MRINNKLKLALFLLFLACLMFNTSCTKKKLDNTLHLHLLENPKSLDPALSQDAIAGEAIGSVYETLYQYHYLKRPYELIPLLAEGMPEYSKDGLTVTIKIKPGVKFQNDRCFKDKTRELVAQDFVYAIKRVADPKIQSDGWWVYDGKLLGLNEWRDASSKSGKSDYNASIEGLQAPDAHTLVLKLKKKYPQLIYTLAMYYSAPVPHEAVEKYEGEFVNHPVGTGPFMVTEYTRNSQIVYEKNPNFHGENFPADEGFSKNPELKDFDYGKPLPLTDKIIAHIMVESQPAWLQFLKGQLDLFRIPKDNFGNAIDKNLELKPELAKKGIRLSKNPSSTEWFLVFNMEDPIIGKNKYLRKAMALAYDSKKDIEIFTNGTASLSNQILPPPIKGYIERFPPREINIEKAKALLAKGGNPNGVGLPKIYFDVESSSSERQKGEFFKTQMAEIGINVEVRVNTRPEFLERSRKGQQQISMGGWIADYPDAENYMELLYGPNKAPGNNSAQYNNPEFNKLFEQMSVMQPSPERQKIIERMNEIMLEDQPWVPNWVATLYFIHQGWMKNYLYSDFSYNNYKYYRVDRQAKEALLK